MDSLRSPELDRTVTLGLSNNRTLQVARADFLNASERVKIARAGLLPQLDATGGLARQQYGADFLGSEAATFPPFSAYSGGVDVSYDLDVFGRTRRTIELAAADRCPAGGSPRYAIELHQRHRSPADWSAPDFSLSGCSIDRAVGTGPFPPRHPRG